MLFSTDMNDEVAVRRQQLSLLLRACRMTYIKELYIADSICGLKIVASKNFDQIRRTKNFESLCRSAKSVYNAIYADPSDEEKVYIFLTRFTFIYDHMLETIGDEQFVRVRFGHEANVAKIQLKKVEERLERRYAEKRVREAAAANGPTGIVAPVPGLLVTNFVFDTNDMFITSHDLANAIKNKKRILLLDVRSAKDFAESHIRNVSTLNVPECLIFPGSTANKIGRHFTQQKDRLLWVCRETYAIVLIDWNTSRLDYTGSIVWTLRYILLEWDFEATYRELPLMLSGGYLDFLEHYPTLSTNPLVMHARVNTELDELLELDDIEYPATSSLYAPPSLLLPNANIKELVHDGQTMTSREDIKLEECEVMKRKADIDGDIIETEILWKGKLADKPDTSKLKEIEEKIARLRRERDQLDDVQKQLAKLGEKSLANPPGDEGCARVMRQIQTLEEQSKKSNTVLDAMAAEREKLLEAARQAKPYVTSLSTINETHNDAETACCSYRTVDRNPPAFDRLTKPDLRPLWSSFGFEQGSGKNGLAGLVNIHNTCYMNTIIQCVRHITDLLIFFCTGRYMKYVTRTPDVLTSETAALFRLLWYNIYNVIEPRAFYRAVCAANSTYGNGHHEDCMEFFTFWLTQMCEDTAEWIDRKQVLSPMQTAWKDILNGKRSLFANLFYHQIKVIRECPHCGMKNVNFEMESTIMLSLPSDRMCSLQQAVNKYLEDVSYYKKMKCCKCHEHVADPKKYKVVSFAPRVLVIDLKRYKRSTNSSELYVKNEAEVHFPLINLRFEKFSYDLTAMALHSGTMQSGHYTAVCKNTMMQEWYEFNDSEVTRVARVDARDIRVKARAFFYVLRY